MGAAAAEPSCGMGLDICRGALMVGFALRLPLRSEILLRSSDILTRVARSDLRV